MKKSDSTDDVSSCILRMEEHDTSAILNGIIHGVRLNLQDGDFLETVKNLEDVSASFFGIPMRFFVIAALDVLGKEKYTGENELILRLIKSKFSW